MALLPELLGPLAVSLLASCLAFLFLRRWRLVRRVAWVPGPPGLPLLGNLLDFCLIPPEDAFEKMKQFTKKYGSFYKLWLGTTPIIQCQDVELVQVVLKQEQNVMKADLYPLMAMFIGNGLLTLETGEKWKVQRKLLSPSFHVDVIESILPPTWRKSMDLVSHFKQFQSNEAIDLIEYLKPSAFDISMETSAGLESNTLEFKDSRDFQNAVERMSPIVMCRVFLPLLKYNFIFNLTKMKKEQEELMRVMSNFAKEMTSKRKTMKVNKIDEDNECLTKEKTRTNVLDNLLLINKVNETVFSDDDVAEQIRTTVFAGYDTLGTSTSYTLFLLGHHPDIQERVVEELEAEVPAYQTEGLSLKSLARLDLLDRCLKESMRLFPPAPMMGRKLTSSVTTSRGTLPAGINVYINFYNLHRDPETFPDPERFDPDRFLPSEVAKRSTYSYLPFGAGARVCIGQKQAMIQAKIMIASVLMKYEVKSVTKIEDLKLIANLVLKSRDGLFVKLTERSKSS